MRQKRAKTYRRVMALYTQTFNFRTPFQILVTNDLILATNSGYDFLKLLTSCVQGEVKPMMTQCCIESLYKLGRSSQPSVDLAKTFERRRCNHREAIDPDACVKDVIGSSNKHRYILAAQSPLLRKTLDPVPGLPIIHFNPRGVLVLSPPSRATIKFKDTVEQDRRMEGGTVVKITEDGANVVLGAAGRSGGVVGKRGRVKGPNPLSVRKKKVGSGAVEVSGDKEVGKVKKRAREEEEMDKIGGTEADGSEGGGGVGVGKRKRKRKSRSKGGVEGAVTRPDDELSGEGSE